MSQTCEHFLAFILLSIYTHLVLTNYPVFDLLENFENAYIYTNVTSAKENSAVCIFTINNLLRYFSIYVFCKVHK